MPGGRQARMGHCTKPHRVTTILCDRLMTIKLNADKQLLEKIDEFERLGGCVQFKVFDVENPNNSYQTHLAIAKQTLIEISKDSDNYFQKIAKELNTDREQYFKQSIDFSKLENSGTQIQLSDFLGPQFDTQTRKPFIKGVQRLYNSYFYYDTEEIEKNSVNLNEIAGQYKFNDSDGVTGAFCGAFLEPPHSVRIGTSIFEHGRYFLEFSNLFFSDLNNIEIYKWSVDCSNYFDAGKEWWGSHFWTIYNPIKNIYIGIVASTTD